MSVPPDQMRPETPTSESSSTLFIVPGAPTMEAGMFGRLTGVLERVLSRESRVSVKPVEEIKPQEKPLQEQAKERVLQHEQEIKDGLVQGPSGKKYAININLERYQSTDDMDAIVESIASQMGDLADTARRGTISFEEQDKMARELLQQEGVNILRWKPGQPVEAVRVRAVRLLFQKAREDAARYARQIVDGDDSSKTMLNYRQSLGRLAAIQLQLHGMAAEAGRVLGQFRDIVPDKLSFEQMNDLLEDMPSHGALRKMAREFLEAPPQAQNRIARASVVPGFWDMVKEHWFGFILSGPATHAVNLTGNSLIMANEVWERAAATQFGRVFALAGREAGVQPGEAAAMVHGYVNALADAMALFWYAATRREQVGESTMFRRPNLSMRELLLSLKRVEAAPDTATKLDPVRKPAITKDNVARMLEGAKQMVTGRAGAGRGIELLSTMAGIYGAGVRTTGALLGAEDELFKAVNFRASLEAQAVREAKSRGLAGEEAAAFIRDFVQVPPEEAVSRAISDARVRTLTDRLESEAMRGLLILSKTVPATFLIPFVRVMGNIMKYSSRRTLGMLSPKNLKALTGSDPVERDLALARITTGAMFWTAAIGFGMKNFDTAGDSDVIVTGSAPPRPSIAKVWRQRGFKPYHIYVRQEDGSFKSFEYRRLDPIGTMLGLAADVANIAPMLGEADAQELAAAMSYAISNNIINKTFMSSIAELVQVIRNGSAKQWESYISRQLASFVVPTAARQVAEAEDPYIRRARTVLEQMKLASPKARGEIPPIRDLWGYPVEDSYFVSRLTGVRAGEVKTDWVADEIWNVGVTFTPPGDRMEGVELDPRQHDRLLELFGHGVRAPANTFITLPVIPGKRINPIVRLDKMPLRDALATLMRHPAYKALPVSDDPTVGRARYIRKVRDMYASWARDRLLVEFPDIKQAIRERMESRAAQQAPGIETSGLIGIELEQRVNRAQSLEVAP